MKEEPTLLRKGTISADIYVGTLLSPTSVSEFGSTQIHNYLLSRIRNHWNPDLETDPSLFNPKHGDVY